METLDRLQRNFPSRPSKRYLEQTLMPKLSSVDCFNSSFWTSELQWKHGCDMDKVTSFFMFLNTKCTHNHLTRRYVRQALEELTSNLPNGSCSISSLRVYLMIPFCDYLEDFSARDTTLLSYLHSLMNLNVNSQDIFVDWLPTLSEKDFRRFVKVFTGLLGRIITGLLGRIITEFTKKSTTQDGVRLYDASAFSNLQACTWILDKLYKVNSKRKDKLCNDSFYVPEITTCVGIEKDRSSCHKDSYTKCQKQFHFCHYPFLYDADGKTRLLHCHNALKIKDSQNQDHGFSSGTKIILLLSIITFLFAPSLEITPEHYLLGVLNTLLALSHGFMVVHIHWRLGILGFNGLQLFDGIFLPEKSSPSRCVCVYFCSLPFLGYFEFIDFFTLMITTILLAIPGAFFGLLVSYVTATLNKRYLFSCAAYALCWWNSTSFILDNVGLQVCFVTYATSGLMCIIFSKHFGIDKALELALRSLLMNHLSKIAVNRHSVLENTIQIHKALSAQQSQALKRSFQVIFCGENDVGPGVDRDYFTAVKDELLRPSRALFCSDKDSSVFWFQRKDDDSDELFYYAGFLTGLAVNNSHHFSLPLPLAVFKKLMDVPVELEDLKELKPVSARNWEKLLVTDGVDDYGLTFEVCEEVNGKVVTYELCEHGGDKPVTDANKKDYVDLLVDFYLNKNTKKEYESFAQGFGDVFDVETLRMYKFQPAEFRKAVVGKEKIDFKKLEQNVTYVGYHSNSRTIRSFWKIVHGMNVSERKAFLRYLTGSEGIPQTGLKLTIYPLNIEDEETSDLMPVAVTCGYALYLPDIPDAERLKDRLFCAINGNPSFTSIPEALGHQFAHNQSQVFLAWNINCNV